MSFDILKEATTFILSGQIDQEDFLLIRFTLENESSSFFQTSKTPHLDKQRQIPEDRSIRLYCDWNLNISED